MSAYSNNLWAEEMSINLDDLERERPIHPDQIRLQRKYSRQAEEYWARERYLARIETHIPEEVHTLPVVKKSAPKRTKVGRYEFTDQQLQIAMRSLDANDTLRKVRV